MPERLKETYSATESVLWVQDSGCSGFGLRELYVAV